MGASLAKMMLDAELVNYVRSYHRKLDLSIESTAADLIVETAFDGNYLMTAHTAKYCRKEHYVPRLFERRSPESWKPGAHEAFMAAVDEKVNQEIDAYTLPVTDRALEKDLAQAFSRYLPDAVMQTEA